MTEPQQSTPTKRAKRSSEVRPRRWPWVTLVMLLAVLLIPLGLFGYAYSQ